MANKSPFYNPFTESWMMYSREAKRIQKLDAETRKELEKAYRLLCQISKAAEDVGRQEDIIWTLSGFVCAPVTSPYSSHVLCEAKHGYASRFIELLNTLLDAPSLTAADKEVEVDTEKTLTSIFVLCTQMSATLRDWHKRAEELKKPWIVEIPVCNQ